MSSAADRFFDIPELLELTLLDPGIIMPQLMSMLRISKTFQSTIAGSKKLQRKLGKLQLPAPLNIDPNDYTVTTVNRSTDLMPIVEPWCFANHGTSRKHGFVRIKESSTPIKMVKMWWQTHFHQPTDNIINVLHIENLGAWGARDTIDPPRKEFKDETKSWSKKTPLLPPAYFDMLLTDTKVAFVVRFAYRTKPDDGESNYTQCSHFMSFPAGATLKQVLNGFTKFVGAEYRKDCKRHGNGKSLSYGEFSEQDQYF